MERRDRNLRSVWTIATRAYAGPHFATFPRALAERCILAGTSARGVCSVCGAPYARTVKRTAMVIKRSLRTHAFGQTRASGTMLKAPTAQTLGWRRTCRHSGAPAQAVVLDPFAGSGTALEAARALGRGAIGIELGAANATLARRRLVGLPPRDDAGKAGMPGIFTPEELMGETAG